MRPHQITNTKLAQPAVYIKDNRCMWTSIPKNANMLFRGICKSVGMNRRLYTGQQADQSFFIIRNPLNRLVSGLGEYRRRRQLNVGLVDLLDQLYENPVSFDEHLEPQLVYVAGKSYTHIIRMENLKTEIMEVPYIRHNGAEVVRIRIDPNKTTNSRHLKGQPMEKWLDENQSKVTAVINKYYATDMQMWENPQNFLNKDL